MNTVAAVGANGILGVGLLKEDCGIGCAAGIVSATYYACAGGACTPSALALSKQVANPVAGLATDNNGIVVSMPAVGAGGVTSLSGSLTLGIGTRANNALGGATRYAASGNGYFTTVYKGTALSASFIDSGSNGVFFNDTSLPACSRSADFYCPANPLTLNATAIAYDGSTSGSVAFTIENVDALSNAVIAARVGGKYDSNHNSGNAFDWGLPFFFGRKVYIGMETDPNGPYWAF